MAYNNAVHKTILKSRSITGDDRNIREYILFVSLGFDGAGKDRSVYSLYAQRNDLVEGGAPTGQVFLYDIAPTREEADRIFDMLSDGEAEPEHCRDIVEDIWC